MNLYNLFQNTAGDQVIEAYDRPFRGVGGAFYRGDDEHHEIDRAREQRDQSGTWYIRINGKILKTRDGQPYTFRGKAAANKAALTMQAKPFNAGKEFKLTTSPEDKQQDVSEGHDSGDLANEVYAEFERTYPNLARHANERTIHAAIMDVLNYGGDNNPGALAQDVARAVKQDMQQGVAEAPTSAAVRLGRAVQRVQGRTAASQARSVIPSSIPKPDAKPPAPVREDEELHIGDPVIVTGPVEFEGSTGEISDFGSGKRFVVVNLYNHGRHSFHTSDISYNDYAGSDEEEARMYDSDPDARAHGVNEQVVEEMHSQSPKGRVKSDGTRSHSTYGSRDHYSDSDPQHTAKPTTAKKTIKQATDIFNKAFKDVDKKKGVAEGSGGNWYIRINGKILNDTKFKPEIFSSEDEARSHAMKLADKKRIPLSQIKLTKSWMDDPEQGVAEGEVVPLGKKHKGDLGDIHSCPKCGGELQGGNYMGQRVKVCQPCKQVYLPPNSGIDQQGNKTNEQGVAEGLDKEGDYHVSVQKGKFLPSDLGGGSDENLNYLHDLMNISGTGGGPMLVTIADPRIATEVAAMYGGKVLKTRYGTYRIVQSKGQNQKTPTPKPELVGMREQGVAEEGYGNHPSQRVDPRNGKKYVPPKSPLGQGGGETKSPAQLDEFLPALAAGAGAVARGAAVAGGAALKGAQAVGSAIKQGVQALAPTVAKGAQAAGRAISKVPAAVEKRTIQGLEVINALVPGGIFNPDGSVKGSQYLTKYLTPQQIQQVQQQGVTEAGSTAQQAAIAIAKKKDIEEEKVRLDPKCWTGKHKEGTKIKGGVRVNNCVPNESVTEGRVKELSADLKSMTDAEFKTRYKMTKAEARANLKPKTATESIQVGDGFIIECGDTAIETVVVGYHDDGILIEFDHTATFMLTDAGVTLTEAEYHGRTVPLGKRMAGDVKKSKVYVKKPNGKVVKVNFGDPNMTIKKHLPKHRKSYRARHHCENPGPKWKANYWSCRAW